MGRYLEAKCRLCRREGTKLFLKGRRCFSVKCPIEKRGAVPPGMSRSDSQKRLSEYGLQLREKQKAKRIYGVQERQFKRYFEKARKFKGATGEVLLVMLERRLDNVVFRLGFAPSRSVARQLVSHGHVFVNGKKVNIPSYQVSEGEIITLSPKALEIPGVKETFAQENVIIPDWLERKGAVGKIKRLPKREELGVEISEQQIVEYYSR